MPRTMGAGYSAAIAAEQAEYVHLLELEFSGGTVRLSTGTQNLSWNAFTWTAVGGLLDYGGVEETSDGRSQGIDLTLSGVDQAVVAILLGQNYRGRKVRVWQAHLDAVAGTVKAAPQLLFEGTQVQPYEIQEDRDHSGGTVQVTTRIIGQLGIDRVRGIKANLVSHQHHFPGDLFFQHASLLAGKTDYWGTTAPSRQRIGGGGPGGGNEPDDLDGDTLL